MIHNRGRSDLLVATIRITTEGAKGSNSWSPNFLHGYRMVVEGDDGFPYVEDGIDFRRYPDGLFVHLATSRFPRDSGQLVFSFEERTGPGAGWERLVQFETTNPQQTLPLPWRADTNHLHQLGDDLSVEIGPLIVPRSPFGRENNPLTTAILPLRFREQGEVVLNRVVMEGSVRDASGNYEGFGDRSVVSNSWILQPIRRPLNPKLPWHFETFIAAKSGFGETNLFSFTIPWPIPGAIRTNFGGAPVTITSDNGSQLKVSLTDEPPGKRLSLVSVRNLQGAELPIKGGHFGHHEFQRTLDITPPQLIEVTVAVHPNYRLEFTIQPELASE